MENIAYETILDIQRKINIVDVIGEYLPLEQRGRNFFAICPFHDDHNPSLSISPEKQIYTCFVCGASGNVFNFVMNYEKISFQEAVNYLANKVGINLNLKNIAKKNSIDESLKKYYDMYLFSLKYYQNNINSIYGKGAIKYLHDRKIDDDIIKEFEIGLSLNDNGLNKLLVKKGFDINDLIDIGLCSSKDNYNYDIFRNRIMFPLWDNNGAVVGFSGRIYNMEDESKYINSKESKIFKKGLLLYNYHRALNYCREKKEVIIVEGFMDVIRLYSIGIKNVVATMGTAITKQHANLIQKLSKNVVLCFDGDKAGDKATKSAINELEKIGLSPKVIRLEDNLDPDDYILKMGKDKFLLHLKNATSSLSYKIDSNKKDINFNDYSEVSNYIKSVVKDLEKVDDKIVYELMINKISKETNVSVDTIDSLVKSIPKSIVNIVNKPKYVRKNKYVKAQEYLIYYMLKSIDAIIIYKDNLSYMPNQKLSSIAMEILDFYEKNGYINTTSFTLFLEDKTDLINEVIRIDSLKLPDSVDSNVIKDYIKTIDEGILKEEIDRIKNEISKETNVVKKISLLERLTSLKKRSVNNERD